MWHEQSLEVERRMKKCGSEYENSEDYGRLTKLLENRDTGYYEAVSEKLTQMRKKYREMVAKP